jgi:hypothetical protein
MSPSEIDPKPPVIAAASDQSGLQRADRKLPIPL